MVVYTEDRLDEITYVGVKVWPPSMRNSGFLSRAPMRPKVRAWPKRRLYCYREVCVFLKGLICVAGVSIKAYKLKT